MYTLLAIPLLVLQAFPPAALGACPPLGSVLPAPTALSSNKVVQELVAEIQATLQNSTAELVGNSTAVSIGVKSIHEQSPFLEFSYQPTIFNKSGTHKVSGDTVYRIASVSKLFTAFAILQLSGDINLSDPVTKYVPELAQLKKEQAVVNSITSPEWDKITIEALLSHLSGIGADFGDQDIANQPANYSALGLPARSTVTESNCGDGPGQRGCTRADFFANVGKKDAIYEPWTTPVYSNNGYAILGFVIEAVTGKTYQAYMQQHVFEPLKLSHTFVSAPEAKLGFIPEGSNWWSTSLGVDASSGGLYSSTNDLLSFGSSILLSSSLTPLQTRQWLKPTTFTSASGVSVGQVWEIALGTKLTLDGRDIYYYTKSGNLAPGTASFILLVPDYDIVIAMNMGGPAANGGIIFGVITQLLGPLMRAVDAAARQEATVRYVGTYKDAAAKATISLSIDDGPGLLVSNFTVRGADVLAAYAQLPLIQTTIADLRLYPTNLIAGNQTQWRGVYDTYTDAEAAAVNAQLFFGDGSCQSWSGIDNTIYGLKSLDEFIFEAGDNGVVETLTLSAWRVALQRSG